MNISTQEKLVLAVITYSAQFVHPLTETEIIERLIKPKFLNFLNADFSEIDYPNKKTKSRKSDIDITSYSQAAFSKAINSLVKKKKIIKRGKFYTLPFTQGAFADKHKKIRIKLQNNTKKI